MQKKSDAPQRKTVTKPILRSAIYRHQVDPKNPQRVRSSARESLADFIHLKRINPAQKYGSSDKLFTGPYAEFVPGLAHAHLSHDLSIVYRLEQGQILLYGMYTHDQLGTGQPLNIRKIQSMAKQFSNMTFTEE